MKCDICGGTRVPSLIAYTTYYDNKPIVVENVPAEVCRQCGEQYFEPETVEKLQKIVWSPALTLPPRIGGSVRHETVNL